MSNVGQMMKKLQDMQARMAEMHERLAATELVGAAGGGMVQVTMTGKGETRRVAIDPSLVNAAEKDVLEDLIVAAVNDARVKVEAEAQAQMSKLTGGLPLPPGFKLPF